MANMFQALDNAYLKDLVNNELLTFGYIPEEISDTKAANYAQIDVPGRSEPVFGYISSGPREFGLHLKFIAGIGQTKFAAQNEEPVPNNNPLDDNTLAVIVKTHWLQSLAYPDYSSSDYTLPPHKVLLSIGLLIKSECIVNSVNVMYKGPYDSNLLPFIAEVDLSLYEVNQIPQGYSDVRLPKAIAQPISTPLIAPSGSAISSTLISPTPGVVKPTPLTSPTIPWGQLKLDDAGLPTIWNGQKYISIALGSIYSDSEGNRYIVRGNTDPSTWYLSKLPSTQATGA